MDRERSVTVQNHFIIALQVLKVDNKININDQRSGFSLRVSPDLSLKIC